MIVYKKKYLHNGPQNINCKTILSVSLNKEKKATTLKYSCAETTNKYFPSDIKGSVHNFQQSNLANFGH